jgi:hypothetical protein
LYATVVAVGVELADHLRLVPLRPSVAGGLEPPGQSSLNHRVRVRVGEAQVLVSCVDEARMVEHLKHHSDSARGNQTGAAPRRRSRRAAPSA